MKYIKISIVILLVSFISIFAYKLTTNNSNNKLSLTKEQMKEMLSYTIDGNSTSSMPTKGSGYKVKSITCKNGSILSWDNDNWLLEVERIESEDLCNIDFTKNETLYNVKLIPTISKSFDSTSKTTTKNGTTTFYTNLKIKNITGCDSEILNGKVVIKNVTSNTTCNVEITKNIYNMLLINNPIIKTRTDFSSAFSETNTETLFKAQEDNTDVYYFSGFPTNNWVKFGTFNTDKTVYKGWGTYGDSKGYKIYDTMSNCTNASSFNSNCEETILWKKGDPMYWRIIRTNKDGSVRLLYHGTSPEEDNAYIEIMPFADHNNDPMYVGYMYGTSGSLDNNRTNENNSKIKLTIDDWYEKNLITYTKYLSNSAVYCNDRNLYTNHIYNLNETFEFAFRERENNRKPVYNCIDVRDSFSVDNKMAKLKYPIGLITGDDFKYSGQYSTGIDTNISFIDTNSKKINSIDDNFWWSMTASIWYDNTAYVVFGAGNSHNTHPGYSLGNGVGRDLAVRPVTSIKEDNLWKSGDGSASNPYEIVLN